MPKAYPPLVKIGKRRDKDPTMTLTLRGRWISGVNRRFGELNAEITKYVVDDNGLGGRPAPAERVPLDITAMKRPDTKKAEKYVYESADARVYSFTKWLDQKMAEGVLEVSRVPGAVGYGGNLWSDIYIYSAYQRGIAQARADLNAAGAGLPDLGPVYAAMNKPFHADRVALLYARAFNAMVGITEVMKSQMAMVLAEGMAEGRNPYDIAYKLRNRVDAIGITRARLIARTEVVRAHNQASLNEFEALEGIVGEEIWVQWWTALDERVRPRHKDWHAVRMKRETAAQRIGEPNCRCAVLPWTKTIAAARKGRL